MADPPSSQLQNFPQFTDLNNLIAEQVSLVHFVVNIKHECCSFTTKKLIRLFRIISIPLKFCYFHPPDHLISMD